MDKEVKEDRRPVHVKSSPKLIIGEEVMEDIRYLNSKISREEWSGIAFYEVLEGDIEDINSLVMELKYVWPMKKGSSTSVEFDFDPEWIQVYNKVPELEDFKRGIIHSHNSMGAFHSGTDYNDLSTNCGIFDFYLSIVTNNRGNFDTKIAIPGEEEKIVQSQYSFKNSFGKLIQGIFPTKEKVKELIMLIHDVEVDAPISEIDNLVFSERVDEIIKEKDNKPTYGQEAYGSRYYHNEYPGIECGLGKPQERQASIPYEWDQNNDTPTASTHNSHKLEDAFSLLYIDGGEDAIIHTLKSMGYLKIDAKNVDIVDAMNGYLSSLEEKLEKSKGVLNADLEKTLDTFIAYFIEGVKLLPEYKEIKDPKEFFTYITEWLEILQGNLDLYEQTVSEYLIDIIEITIQTYEQ